MATDIVGATDAVLGDLKTRWDSDGPAIITPAPALVFEPLEDGMKPHPRDEGLAWARITIRHGAGRPAAIGKRRFRRDGNAFVQIFVPFKDASAYTAAQQLGKVVQLAYEGKRSAVTYRRVAVMEKGSEGAFYRVDCVVAFEWDEIKN